jgi:hypothetical protein
MLLTATGSTATMAIVCFLQQCTAMAVWAVLFAYTPEVRIGHCVCWTLCVLGTVCVGHCVYLDANSHLPHPPQVYPTTLRTKALGTANLIDRVGGIIGPYLGGYFVSEVGTTFSQSCALYPRAAFVDSYSPLPRSTFSSPPAICSFVCLSICRAPLWR